MSGPIIPFAYQRAPVEEQVIEIEDAKVALARSVGAEDLRERLAVLIAPREELCQDLTRRRLGVDGARMDVEHRCRARKAPRTIGSSMLLTDEVEQVAGVAGVENAEAAARPSEGGVDTDQAMSDGVECAADDPAGVGGDSFSQRACSLDHLPGRTPGECEQEVKEPQIWTRVPCAACGGAAGERKESLPGGGPVERSGGTGRQAR